MTLREKIEVMQAFERGEEIEASFKGIHPNGWLREINPLWNWVEHDYRIKPKKQTVVIEKWLCISGGINSMCIIEANKEYFDTYAKEKVKFLDTYEVEL